MLAAVMSVVRQSIWVMGEMVPPIDPSGLPCEQPCATPLRTRQSGGKALKEGAPYRRCAMCGHMRAQVAICYV